MAPLNHEAEEIQLISMMSEHRETLDSFSLIDIANEFVKLQQERLNIFGKFTEKDL